MNDLTTIEISNPLVVFSTPHGLDAIIDKIEAEVKNIDRDISTEEGRDNIRSIAFKLAKSKTALDKMGKDLTEEQRKQIEAVNAERKRAWERMETLQHEIRKPLTDWEDAEKKRVADHEAALAHIESLGVFMQDTPITTADIEERIKQFNALAPRVWQEFEPRYNYTVKTLSDGLAASLAESQKRDAEAAELERLRAEEAARKQKEHEERIAAEAAEKAKKAAEEKAAADAEAERQRTEKERLRIEAEKQAAVDAAAKAESDRLAAIAKAESDRIAAEEKAKRDEEAAAQRERDKIAAEKKAEADALAAREADHAHKKKINNEAMGVIHKLIQDWSGSIEKSDGEEAAKQIIIAIAKGEIPHVKIIY